MVNNMKFPEGFLWGASTSSYQVEGNIYNTDWAKAAEEGKVPKAGRSGDHFNRFKEDFALAKELGHNAHRFSVEWARIEPEEGKFSEEAIRHYQAVLRNLQEHNLEPFITLWHFTLPLWFSESGGWLREDAPEIFARYCAFVVDNLGDQCEHFSTINEPNVYATHSYIYGAWPPFARCRILWKKIGNVDGTSEGKSTEARFANFFRYFRVTKQLARGHRLAYEAIKAKNERVKVSVVKHVHYFYANQNPFNKIRAKLMQYLQTQKFMDSVIDRCDEIGLNFYRSTMYGDGRKHTYTDMGWKIVPEDIYGALKLLAHYEKPIFIAEAGLADENDTNRESYIKTQVKSVWQAIEEGVDVRAHLYWSLLDNYEWAHGYEKRFGLIEINYETLERKIRPSAFVYKRICEENGIVE